jgi:hypothetical protein
MIYLAHARVERGNYSGNCSFFPGVLRQRFQCAYTDYRQVCTKCQPLSYAARNAQSGERPWPRAESDTIQLRQRQPGLIQRASHHRQNQFRMTLFRKNLLIQNLAIPQQRNRAIFGRCIESENFQGKIERLLSIIRMQDSADGNFC